jgi:hypothetical protein
LRTAIFVIVILADPGLEPGRAVTHGASCSPNSVAADFADYFFTMCFLRNADVRCHANSALGEWKLPRSSQ